MWQVISSPLWSSSQTLQRPVSTIFGSGKFVCMCPIPVANFMVHKKSYIFLCKFWWFAVMPKKAEKYLLYGRLAGSWHSLLANLSSTITYNWSAGVRCKAFNPMQVRKTRDLIWQQVGDDSQHFLRWVRRLEVARSRAEHYDEWASVRGTC